MNTQKIATFLRTVPLFHELTPEQVEQLAQSAGEKRFFEGELISEAKNDEPRLFVLVEGECIEYLKHTDIGYEGQTRRLYPGDFLGIESILVSRTSSTRTTAVADGRGIELSKHVLEEMMDQSPPFVRTICRVLASRVQRVEDMVSGLRYVRLENCPETNSLRHLLPRRLQSAGRCLAIQQQGDRVTVAMVNPADVRTRSFIENVLRDFHVQFVAMGEDDFEQEGRRLLGERIEANVSTQPFDNVMYQDMNGVMQPLQGSREDDLALHILTVALRRGASDIHFEPFHGNARVRLRIDGRMVIVDEHISGPTYSQLISRIKILSELDTTRIRRPLDGRFLVFADDHPVEFRVSASPCHGGEKIVLRVIAPSRQQGELAHLILHPGLERMARQLFQNPSGLVLVTGPSGAGKTTTLYAALQSLIGKDCSKNVVTIEDPVEYDLPFATQIQVNPDTGMDFATILKSVLRQDPDVILVGEIRDPKSAAMAAEAATTGHLVLSSLHSYSALEAIVRLRDLKVPHYVTAAALRGVITQQLVARLEPGFTQDVPSDDEVVQQLCELGVLGQGWDQPLQRGRDAIDGPPGGERGRVAIFEMLSVTSSLSGAIDRSSSIADMKKCLTPKCYASFFDYARFLLKEGIVAPERILEMIPRGADALDDDDASADKSHDPVDGHWVS